MDDKMKRAAQILETEFGKDWLTIAQMLGTEDLRRRVGKELTSFMAFPERGNGGNNQWRGNCSPEVVYSIAKYVLDSKKYYGKDVSDFTVLDPMSGSGTTKDAVDRLGVKSILYDLNPNPPTGKGNWNALKNDVEDSADLIFFHPPYHNIIAYSGNMWGKPHPDDLSRCENYGDFVEKLNYVIKKLYTALRKDGRLAILVGDIRSKGNFYSMQHNIMRMGRFESFIVKGQFNCTSDSRRYAKPFMSGNIHKIVESITNPNFEHNFSLWSKAIVSILYICQFPLSKEDLFGILTFCHLYSSNPMDTFEKSITDLFTMAIISKTDTYYELQSINYPDVYVLVNSYTDQIVYKRNVLAYYKTKKQHSKKLAELLYRLSDELKDADCKKYARILIKHSLQDGSKIPENLIDSADFNADSFEDCILCSIIYARKREYNNALKWLEKIDTDANLYIKAFWGILLNRTRNHNKAETVLYQVLGKIENLDIKAIGYSFLISNHIHKEELNKAQELYFIAKDCCKGSKNLGYLIRNAISAFEDHSLDMYNEALEHFLLTNDMFGYYSTLCNKGYSILSTETEQGKKDLIESYQNLNLYGENISHIVCNDLGIAYLLKNDYENAKYFFDKVIANEDNSMPKIFSKINLACCDALAGNIQLAIKSIFDLQEEVENSPLDRIRQKYYINRLLIEYLANMPVDKQIMEKAKEYPDRYNPEKTISAIEFYEKHPLLKSGNHLENWLPLYSPCGLVYWYINPLKIFPESIADEIISI